MTGLFGLALCLALVAGSAPPAVTVLRAAPAGDSPASAAVVGPFQGRTIVVAGQGTTPDLATALGMARDGDVVEVRGGVHRGPLVVARAVALVGVGWPVIDGGGRGTVLTFEVPGGSLSGFVVQNSGTQSEKEDAAVLAKGRVTLIGNRLEDVLYGLDLQQAPGSVVTDNVILGRDLEIARRGDAIRLWESKGARVERNTLRRARDMVIWYSEDVLVKDNVVTDCRYGLHFMYASGSHVVGNRFEHNGVGAYAMYSSGLLYEQNLFLGNHGLSGYGLGLKDSDDITVRGNTLAGNRVGLTFDNSPAKVGSSNRIEGNTVAFNDVGAAFLPAVKHNQLGANNFVDNVQQVAVLASGAFEGNDWTPGGQGNYWSNYNGYDEQGDRIGDLPHQEISLFDSLMTRQPTLRLFVQTPAQNTMDLAARAFPVFRPAAVLTDTAPRTVPYPSAVAAPVMGTADLLPFASLLLGAALLVVAWGLAMERIGKGAPAPAARRAAPTGDEA